ncbi:hypothetical protein ABZP36_022500 [Zizania latifolia]
MVGLDNTAYHTPGVMGWGDLPSMSCPQFDGNNPQVWRNNCEIYFDTYGIHPGQWVRLAILSFTGNASFWLQSVRSQLIGITWEELCDRLCARFSRDKHESLIRQWIHLEQDGTVTEYVERFESLMHQLLAYENVTSPIYFVTKFVEGLRNEIRSAVIMHRPKDLDSACALALLQEEALDGNRRKESTKGSSTFVPRNTGKGVPLPLPLPPLKVNATPYNEIRRNNDDYRSQTRDDRVAALRAYRRSKGLCFTCGEKWGPEHTCSTSIQLHVVEELIHAVQGDNEPTLNSELHSPPETELCMALSPQAANGTESVQSFRVRGWVQGAEMLMLVDSGSTHSFIDHQLGMKLLGVESLPRKIPVRIANGEYSFCTLAIPACKWWLQGREYSCNFWLLELGSYDAILGMDWLQEFSPMRIDWNSKWLEYAHQGQTIRIQGIIPQLSSCNAIRMDQVKGCYKQESLMYMLYLCVSTSESGEHTPLEIQDMLQNYTEVFDEPKGLPPTRTCDHYIPLIPGSKPVCVRPYRYNPAQKDEIEKQVKEMLQTGVIQNSTSAFSSPALLVKNKDGSWRLVIDYRQLNSITVKGKYPLPVIDELLDELQGARIFSKLDLRSGYHQIRMGKGDEHKTAFQTHLGHFEYKVMSFGLTGSARIAGKVQLEVKLSKCSFGQPKLAYLGHVISGEGVSTDPQKIEDVIKWPPPTNLKQLRGFLGLTRYYRKFVKGYGILSKPLTRLLKKDVAFKWSPEAQLTFEKLKQSLVTAPILALLDFSRQFVVETDASDMGLGAVLSQDGHPVAYISKAIGSRTKGLSTYEKECLAILMAVDHWRSYLQHGEFLIYTDHRSLTHLSDQKLLTPMQQKAFTKLLGLQYKIIYKKGTNNVVADALSRRNSAQISELCAMTHCQPQWLSEVYQGYQQDPFSVQLLSELALDPMARPEFSLCNGLLKYRGRIWVGNNQELQFKLISALHDSPVGGHSGFPVTYQRIKRLFAWKGMKTMIQDQLKNCTVCQQSKPERVKYPGLLQPLPVPDGAWQVISMDFIEGLPTSETYNCIFVVVDKFSKVGLADLRHSTPDS